MMRNVKITTSSILSILIIAGLVFIFGLGFLIVLGIFFITKLYGFFFKNKKQDTSYKSESKDDDDSNVIDI